jgi:hypothetical protein
MAGDAPAAVALVAPVPSAAACWWEEDVVTRTRTMRRPTGTPRPHGTPAEQRRAVRRALLLHLVVLAVLAVVLAVVWAVRFVPNEDHPAAQEAVAALDARFADWREGELVLAEEPTELGDGVVGARLPRAVGSDRWVLVAQGGTRCYALWWDDAGVRRGRTLAVGMPCAPTPEVTSQRLVDIDQAAQARMDPTAPFDWSALIPDAERFRVWFLPAMIVGLGVVLSVLVRASIILITHDPTGKRHLRS